jgi:hypothetical protein
MKRNKHWDKPQRRHQLRRQRILLGVTAAGFTLFALLHFAVYTLNK